MTKPPKKGKPSKKPDGKPHKDHGKPPKPPHPDPTCEDIERDVNGQLEEKCLSRANYLQPCDDHESCTCGTPGDPNPSGGVDLVVLIDSSGSMVDAARAISAAAPAAFDLAVESCGAKANVTYLFVDRSDSGSTAGPFIGIFAESHEQFLIGAGVPGPFGADGDGPLDSEQGGRAIVDLSTHYPWTEGYCRAILYISDEKLDSISKLTSDSLAASNAAIAAANANDVSIFTHFVANATGTSIPPGSPNRATIAAHYQAMSDQTGGQATIDGINPPDPTVITEALYVDILSEAICGGCGTGKCETAEFPDLKPCVTIGWGDSDCDCMEGDDHEELCISICNCYDNVTFRDVKISALIITDAAGNPPPRLPDGSPSSEIYPLGPICFGDIGPCVDGEGSCVSRNAMIINRGLPAGTWKVRVQGLCFDVAYHYDFFEHTFELEVCKN